MVSEGSEYPTGERYSLPETITAGGVTPWLTRHLRREPDDGVTAARIQYALENWSVRGICENREGNEVSTYWGFVPGRSVMLRVVVSLDDAKIISDAHCRVVENGDFVGYWQECDGGRYWDVVAMDLRRASVHLAPAIAALLQPASVDGG